MYSSLGIYANLGLNQLKISLSYNAGKPLTMLLSASPGVLNFKIVLSRGICGYATQENLTSSLLHLNYPPKLKVIATPAGKCFL